MAYALAQVAPSKSSWLAGANTVLRNIARYLLAVGMMLFGMSKLFNYQFQVPAWVDAKPLAEIGGFSLTWAFLGYQPWFQCLLGILELVPAVLLLLSRTRRVGAILLLPMLLNVALMSYALDFWQTTNHIGTVFLVMNLYLLACDWSVWREIVKKLMCHPDSPSRWRLVEFTGPLLIVPGTATFLFSQVSAMQSPLVDFIGDRQINRAGTWAIRQISLDGRVLPDRGESFLYFGFKRSCRFSAEGHMSNCKFQADRTHHSFRIDNIVLIPGFNSIHGTYRIDDDRIILDGSSSSFQVVLERYRWGKQLAFQSTPKPISKVQ